MGRSVKKGPFVQPVLLKRIQEMNEKNEKVVLKTVCPHQNLQRSRRQQDQQEVSSLKGVY